jgi:CheY-like chemotaxis protein
MAQIGLLEDNVYIAKLCATMFQYAGHQVTVYDHPRTCLDALLLRPVAPEHLKYASYQDSPAALPVDVLILDIHLPDMDGLEVVHLLHSQPRTRSLPLIFCTAASSSDVMRALRIAPDASFLGKPFTFQELTSAITRALSSSRT